MASPTDAAQSNTHAQQETKAERARREILAAIENDDLTWEYAGMQTRVKWWESETDYRTLSKIERAVLFQMEQAGEIKRQQGWRFGIGGYVHA